MQVIRQYEILKDGLNTCWVIHNRYAEYKSRIQKSWGFWHKEWKFSISSFFHQKNRIPAAGRTVLCVRPWQACNAASIMARNDYDVLMVGNMCMNINPGNLNYEKWGWHHQQQKRLILLLYSAIPAVTMIIHIVRQKCHKNACMCEN